MVGLINVILIGGFIVYVLVTIADLENQFKKRGKK